MRYIILIAISLSLWMGSACASTGDAELQRKQFLQAEKALRRGQLAQFDKLKHALKDYPLLPYLEYQALRKNFSRLSNRQVSEFLDNYQDQPVAIQLRRHWLNLLAKQHRWKEYLVYYVADSSVSRECHYLNALIQTGDKKQAFAQVEPVWLHGRSRPKACDPVFQVWQKSDQFTNDLVWQRIELAMDKGQTRLASYLGKFLDNQGRTWLERWLRVHRKPATALQASDFSHSHPYREKILVHAVYRLARSNPLEALQLWEKLQRQHEFGQLTAHLANRRLSLALVRNTDPEAYRFVASMQPCGHDNRLQDTQLMAGLMHQDWEQVKRSLDNLPQAQMESERWRYWRARTLEQLGEQTAADEIYRKLATERSYYGFLAADQAGAPYALSSRETPVSLDSRIRVNLNPAIERARELVALERWTPARREWRFASKNMPIDDLMSAAKLAESWGWHDQAIFTLARSAFWDDLELRFPLQHEEEVARLAMTTQLDNAWIFAVIRQESAFNPKVESRAGAIGLMQLMPATARHVATRVLKKSAPRKSQLTDPRTNIELGATYLRNVLDKLAGNPVLATAAYNAGPHRINRWLPTESLPADIWVELIPFKETRKYVKRVMTYAAIYDQRLGRKPTRLSERMPVISGDGPASGSSVASI